jgi:uncharacterized LabA/DUF88 family protein
MRKTENNYAFIDGQNLHLGIKKMGWKLDHKKFRIYLKEKYSVSRAYLFIGFLSKNQKLYAHLEKSGFILVFKPTVSDGHGNIKGNVDGDLILRAATEIDDYHKAIIVSSDGDFYSLVAYLRNHRKLETVLSPDEKHCSYLLRKAALNKIRFMNNLQNKLAHNKKGTA